MLLAESAMEIRILHRQGVRAREIARCTGHNRNTVERHLRSDEMSCYAPRPPVAGKLAPYEAWLAERISVVVLLRELGERGCGLRWWRSR